MPSLLRLLVQRRKRTAKAKARPRLDSQGGFLPRDPEKARASDLITLPTDVQGTSCFNCSFADHMKQFDGNQNTAFCINEMIHQYITNRQCCSLWNNPGTLRNGKIGVPQENS